MRKVIVLIVIIVICFAGASCEFYGCHGIGYECLDMCDTSSDSKKSLMLKYNTDFVLNARITEIVDEEMFEQLATNLMPVLYRLKDIILVCLTIRVLFNSSRVI